MGFIGSSASACARPGRIGGLAQWEVAERMGISEAFYARIEQDRASLTLARFVRLVSVLGVSPDSLLSGNKPIIYRDDRLLRWPHDDASMEVRRICRRLRFAPEQWVGLIAHILDTPSSRSMTPRSRAQDLPVTHHPSIYE